MSDDKWAEAVAKFAKQDDKVPVPSRLELQAGMFILLERTEFDCWLTATRRINKKQPYNELRNYRYFMERLETPSERYFINGYIYSWTFVEKKPGGDKRVHIHALIRGIDPERIEDLEIRCMEYFGSAVVKKYDYWLPKIASEYMAKRYAQGYIQDYDFQKINSKKWRHQKFKHNWSQIRKKSLGIYW